MPEIERTGPKLIYKQIVDWMRSQITSGNWPEHYRLPSELELVSELKVSRGTLRKAINQLTKEGLLLIVHGRGTFVASPTIEQPLAEKLVGFSEALIDRNIPFVTQVVEQKLILPPQRIASLLSVAPDVPILLLKRVRLVRQQPVVLLVNYLNITRCPGIEKVNFERFRLFETLENHYKLKLGWGQRSFQAQSADETVAALLKISPSDPVMYMEQLLYLSDAKPIEFSTLWFKGSSFRLSAMVNRGPQKDLQENTMIIGEPSDFPSRS
jgi:DNA-binding GntR family transcriptional regulator